jgi:hypothetical protein
MTFIFGSIWVIFLREMSQVYKLGPEEFLVNDLGSVGPWIEKPQKQQKFEGVESRNKEKYYSQDFVE